MNRLNLKLNIGTIYFPTHVGLNRKYRLFPLIFSLYFPLHFINYLYYCKFFSYLLEIKIYFFGVKDKVAHYSNSQDFDSLLFGCPRQLQNLSKSLRRKEHGRWKYQKIVPVTINLKENLKRLGIDQFQPLLNI